MIVQKEVQPLSKRVSCLEFKTCDVSLSSTGVHVRGEIIKWQGDTHYVIAVWDRNSDGGFDLRFIGKRPFESVGISTFWKLAEFGQRHLSEPPHNPDEADRLRQLIEDCYCESCRLAGDYTRSGLQRFSLLHQAVVAMHQAAK